MFLKKKITRIIYGGFTEKIESEASFIFRYI